MQSLWMLVASFLFSLMSACVKLVSPIYTTSEIVFFRGALGMLFILAIIKSNAGTVKTALWKSHLWRSVVGVSSLWLWFYSFQQLPLATAVTLNYTAPIWIAAILATTNWWYGHKNIDPKLILAIITSFIGVGLLLRPTIHADQLWSGLIALSSGIFAALAYLQVRHLSLLGEPEYRVVFYFSFGGLVAGLIGCMLENSTRTPILHTYTYQGFLLLILIGISATGAQIAMTRAYRLGNTLLTSNLQYSGILFACLFGFLIWGDTLDFVGWIGITTILGSGLIATFYHAKKINGRT